MADDRIEVEVELDPDEASARRSGQVLEDALTKAMNEAIQTFAAEMRKTIRGIAADFKTVGTARFAADMHGIVEDTLKAARATSDFGDEMKALELRARAVAEAIEKTGNNRNLGASIESQLRRLLKLQQDADRDAQEIARDPAVARAYEARFDTIRTALLQDVNFTRRILEQQTNQQVTEQRSLTALLLAESRERTTATNAERSRNVVATQRAAALELEASRGANKQRLQDERNTARQRLAVFQALAQQVRVIERAIGAGFRGAGSLLGGITNTVSGATSRIGQIFRRSDAEMNAGLAPALERRSSIFRRELRQTESIIQSSVVRQSRLFQQAEVQASRGLAGVATGRSQAGALLGGGLAIGGGFALITKLREGFQESVNLNESLNKTQQIFGAATDSILEFADTSVDALFVTKSAALEAAANFGIFGKSAGLAGPQLADFSKRLTLLATDLASFNNTSIGDATTAIAAALRGESEPIRKYGVLLNEAVLQQRALSEGITDTIRKLTPQERVLAANAEILAQTSVQQGDAARTADDFANSSRRAAAASTEFFASIAKFAIPAATALTNGILPVFKTLTDLVNNDVGPGLKIVRDAAIGAGAALGSLLAAKGTIEVLKFLAIGLKAVATPMGLLVTSVGLVGAAINILAKRSPALTAALRTLRDTVQDLVGAGLNIARDLLGRLADVIVERVLPAVERFAIFLARNLQDAVRSAFGFFERNVLPVLQRFAGFIRNDVVPAVTEFASVVRERVAQGLVVARDAAVSFFNTVRPFLDPVIEGFKELGEVIRTAVSGDFSGALESLRNFGTEAIVIAGAIGAGLAVALINPLLGLGVAITGVLGLAFGPKLLELIKPQAERAAKFLRDVFSPKNLSDVGVGFLKTVRKIGEIVGSIVSDRRFVLALAGIVGAFAATGAAAIVGFGQGVASNLPELERLLGTALKRAFSEAFKFAFSNPDIIIKALAVVIAGRSILALFRRAGEQGALAFSGGLLRGAAAGVAGTPRFAAALFGGEGALERAGKLEAGKARKAVVKEFEGINRDITALGGTGRSLTSTLINPTEVAKSRFELKKLETSLGSARVAGAFAFNEITRTVASGRDALIGLKDVLKGDVKKGFQEVADAGKRFGTVASDAIRRVKESGVTLGVALGAGITGGLSAALSGQIAGSSTSGTGQALGIAGIISSALFAGGAIGGGPGVIVGAGVAAVGLFTAAMASSERAAQGAKDRVNAFVDALKDVKGPAETAAAAIGVMSDALSGLGTGPLTLLERAGISIKSIGVQFANGTLDAKALERQVLDTFRVMVKEGDISGKDLGQALRFIDQQISALEDSQIRIPLLDAVRNGEVSRSLGDVGRSLTSTAIGLAGVDGAGKSLRGTIDDVVKGIVDGTKAAIVLGQQDPFAGMSDRAKDLGQSVTDIGLAIDSLNQARSDRLNDRIRTLGDELENAREAAELAQGAVTSFLTSDYQDTLFEQFDTLVGQIPSVGQAVGEAVKTGAESALGASALRSTFEGFESQLAGLIQQGVTDGIIVDKASAAVALSGLFAAIDQGVALDPEDAFDEDAGDRLRAILQGAIDNGDFEATIGLLKDSETEVQRLQRELDLTQFQLNADVVFSPEQIRRALIDALNIPPGEAADAAANLQRGINDALFDGVSGTPAVARTYGEQTVDGYVSGIESGTLRAEAAVRNMATATELALADQLQIRSPSKVFEALGVEIPAGLVAGIEAGAPGAAAALRELSSTLFQRLLALPGTLSENLQSVLVEIPAALEPIAASIQPVTDSIDRFVTSTFDAIAALEGLAGVDLSKLEVGVPDTKNPQSNTGRTATRVANDLSFAFRSSQPHPPGWIQAEDGTWVPPSFFDPPPSVVAPRAPSLDMREGAVADQPIPNGSGVTQFIEANVYETSNARATARETIMALKTAPFTTAPVSGATRIPADVVG